MKAFTALFLAAAVTGSAYASDGSRSSLDTTPSAGNMVFDLLIARPLGLAATVLGTGAFVLQLPFDVMVEGGVKTPFKQLVLTPAKFTFARPLGSED